MKLQFRTAYKRSWMLIETNITVGRYFWMYFIIIFKAVCPEERTGCCDRAGWRWRAVVTKCHWWTQCEAQQCESDSLALYESPTSWLQTTEQWRQPDMIKGGGLSISPQSNRWGCKKDGRKTHLKTHTLHSFIYFQSFTSIMIYRLSSEYQTTYYIFL